MNAFVFVVHTQSSKCWTIPLKWAECKFLVNLLLNSLLVHNTRINSKHCSSNIYLLFDQFRQFVFSWWFKQKFKIRTKNTSYDDYESLFINVQFSLRTILCYVGFWMKYIHLPLFDLFAINLQLYMRLW